MTSEQSQTTKDTIDGCRFTSTELKSVLITVIVVGVVVIIVCTIMFWVVGKARYNYSQQELENKAPSCDQVKNPKDQFTWSVGDVVIWIYTIKDGKFKQYSTFFREQQVNGAYLCIMSKSDLFSLGIHHDQHRADLHSEIQNLNLSRSFGHLV